MAELDLWKASGIDIDNSKGPWYRDTGQGMGPALNGIVDGRVSSLTGRRGSFKNRDDLAILVEGGACSTSTA
jgi:tungstate transport system substrate-binding protein